MKIIILIDQRTQRVVRAYSEQQPRFATSQNPTEFPNCEKHIIEISKITLVSNRETSTIANKIINELKQWEGLSEEIGTFEQEDLDSLINTIEDLVGKHLIRKKVYIKPHMGDVSRRE